MGLRGHRKKRQDRQAALVARRELDSGQGSYQPDRSRCVERAWSYYADEECTVEVQTHIWHENGRLVDFAIVFLALSPTGPTELERIDCRHGSTHLHLGNGETVLLAKLDSIDDVQPAFDAVEPVAQERAVILTKRELP